jgi:hypothetical protein
MPIPLSPHAPHAQAGRTDPRRPAYGIGAVLRLAVPPLGAHALTRG